MGKIAGSSDHRTVRGYFAVMVGGLLLLVAIVLNQFQPGGSWTVAGDAVEAPPSPADEVLGQPAATEPGQESAGTGPADGVPAGPDARRPAGGTQYIDGMDDETDTDPILDLSRRRREERRAVEEAGGGESEGFELAERELIEHASHGDDHTPSKIMQDAVGPDEEPVDSVSGESDEEHLPD
jgi:hypothetical protein